jgi:hypothetical protein
MRKLCTLLVLFLSFTPGFLIAQVTTAQVSGRITGTKNEVLEGVSIKLVNPSTGSSYDAHTNKDGRYLIANLNPGGPYTITITFVGLKAEERNDLNLTLGTNTINFKMQDESAILEAVVVKGGRRGGLKTGAGIQIGQNQLKSLPTISRSLQDMTRVTPQSNNNSFMGTNFRYNNVTLDGAINNDAIGFSPSLGGQTNASGQPGSSTRTNPVSMDAIQDIQVYLAPYDVKIGNFLGGSINAVTRSGTNEVHGSLYGFGRNASLVGKNNAGDKSKLPSDFHDYQTGFRLGFPIIKNKLFFFTNEEITRRQDPIILAAGSPDMKIISQAEAIQISDYMKTNYGVDPGTYGDYKIYSNSTKFFNRLDWHINSKNQLSIRNNTIRSEATNLERDQQNFRFGGIDFRQVNNQTSTVAELKTRFSNALSNSLVLGYSSIHDYREPVSNTALPQIQISNNSGTIFLGTDREASIFNMKQKTFEFTDNVTYLKGNNTFTFGTHNEFYNITYGFVNAWNGRVEYNNIGDFLNNRPFRVRTAYNYGNNTRDYIMNNPPAEFKVNLYSVYGQDEIQIGSKFKLTPGIRFDLADMPNKQPLSVKTTGAPVDPTYGTTYGYTQPKDIQNKFLGKVQISPRIGFNYDIKGDQSLILRGGTGVFTGRIPFAWLGYAYYNNGVTYGAYDAKGSGSTPLTPAAGSDPIRDAITGTTGEANYAQKNGTNVTDPTTKTQVDLIDNNFKMPQAWRSSLALEHTTASQWKFSIEGIYTKVIYDLKFQQVNLLDNPTYMVYDVNKQQPIFPGTGTVNSKYTSSYLLSNTKDGYRYSLTGQVNKTFRFGLNVMAAYTYGQSKDITNGIRNSMESNWQLNQALNPNNPGVSYSNFDTRHRIVSVVNYRVDWNKSNKFISNFAFFFNTSSGVPFTYGTLKPINNSGQQVGLVYIPTKAELGSFFTNPAVAAAFDAYVDSDKYLSSRRGNFTERNGGRTPWNTQLDFRFSQDFNIKSGSRTHTITFTYDILNLTNLLSSSWGRQYFSPNTFNSTADIGLGSPSAAGNATTYPKYDNWKKPSAPYSIDFFGSRYQMQAGLRYSF